MAGTQVNSYGVGDTDLTNLMETVDTQRQGYHKVSLTQMSTTTQPAIAEGSMIEVGGALFKFASDEAITGSPSDGAVYIKLTPSGTSITASFTNTAPTWDDEKGGYYESATTNRYVNFAMFLDTTLWYNKYEYPNTNIWGADAEELNSYLIEDETSTGTLITSLTVTIVQTVTKDFKVFKPVTLYSDFSGLFSLYGIILNPGYYRFLIAQSGSNKTISIYIKQNNSYALLHTATVASVALPGTCHLYLSGVYGIDNSNDIEKIIELI